MKKFLAVLCGAMLALSASAQGGNEGGVPAFGVRLSWDLNSPSTNLSEYGAGSGFSVGAIYNIPIMKGLWFEPGLNFFYNTMSLQVLQAPGVMVDGSVRNSGFRVPLLIGYRIMLADGIALSPFTGPQFNYGFYMKEHYPNVTAPCYGHGWSHWDAQWLFGVRFHYQDNWIAEISGGPGISDLWSGPNHLRRNIFSIGVGYMF